MKRTPTVVAALALASATALFSCKDTSTKTPAGNTASTPAAMAPQGTTPTGRIAYVDIDTLESNYEYFKTKKADFLKRQEAMESELQRSAAQLQQQAVEYQKKGQSGGFTSQADAEAAGRRIQQMEQSLNTRRQTLTESLLKDQEAFNTDLKKRLDEFLEGFAKERGYDYVLSYSKSGSILFANRSLDVTRDVISGMNARLKEGANK